MSDPRPSDHSGPRVSDFPPQVQYPTQFGRGWIPASRDIGLPGDEPCGFPDDRGGDAFGDAGSSLRAAGEAIQSGARDSGLLRGDASLHDEGGEDGARVTPHTSWTDARKVAFLHYLSEKGDVRAACARVGMSRTSAYLLRRRDRVFAQGWGAALVVARGHVEDVLATRALDGVEEAVFYHGEQVAVRRRYDSRLLLAHLARLDRLADETIAGEETGDLSARFDEVLALLSGEAPGADFVRTADEEGEAEPLLPLTREEFADSTAARRETAAFAQWQDAYRAGEAGREDEPVPAYHAHRARAAADWDAWQARAFARVDTLLGAARAGSEEGGPGEVGPAEYKSLDGPAGFLPGLCKPCKPASRGGGEDGRAARVVDGGARPVAYPRKIALGGNGSGGVPLSPKTVGAVPSPPPS
jgi:hypothetical protein